jgi:uncharacterized protein YecE (DUF72 family)
MARLGTAGWNVPTACRERIGGRGSHLERYAQRLNATEINSSFHRPHRRTTYERWARATPDAFRFAAKVPKSVSHSRGLAIVELDRFVGESAGLGEKLAAFLVQFPPSRIFDEGEAQILFQAFQERSPAALVCEPRHASWFTPEVDRWLSERRISRAAADPARVVNADHPGGWQGLRYFRLHGSPRVYYSSYEEARLCKLAAQLSEMLATSEVWCMFDNTTLGAAMQNVLSLQGALSINKPAPGAFTY